ncbi:hypothetical protein QAD02_008704 [Eretmocerus hayati]|uniref:Uncharacterized protein n=1 Tax=Eretmocerus hayati TaxID=131215 RepID=A0ACC2N7K1_9HYME|nr:hypothetical protein QAD02_008704 [Eretmocerus hayati]
MQPHHQYGSKVNGARETDKKPSIATYGTSYAAPSRLAAALGKQPAMFQSFLRNIMTSTAAYAYTDDGPHAQVSDADFIASYAGPHAQVSDADFIASYAGPHAQVSDADFIASYAGPHAQVSDADFIASYAGPHAQVSDADFIASYAGPHVKVSDADLTASDAGPYKIALDVQHHSASEERTKKFLTHWEEYQSPAASFTTAPADERILPSVTLYIQQLKTKSRPRGLSYHERSRQPQAENYSAISRQREGTVTSSPVKHVTDRHCPHRATVQTRRDGRTRGQADTGAHPPVSRLTLLVQYSHACIIEICPRNRAPKSRSTCTTGKSCAKVSQTHVHTVSPAAIIVNHTN